MGAFTQVSIFLPLSSPDVNTLIFLFVLFNNCYRTPMVMLDFLLLLPEVVVVVVTK